MVRKKTPQNIAIIIMKGMEEFGNKVVDHLFSFIEEGNKEDMIINHVEPRFVTGEGKAVLQNSVRGKDVFRNVRNFRKIYIVEKIVLTQFDFNSQSLKSVSERKINQ